MVVLVMLPLLPVQTGLQSDIRWALGLEELLVGMMPDAAPETEQSRHATPYGVRLLDLVAALVLPLERHHFTALSISQQYLRNAMPSSEQTLDSRHLILD